MIYAAYLLPVLAFGVFLLFHHQHFPYPKTTYFMYMITCIALFLSHVYSLGYPLPAFLYPAQTARLVGLYVDVPEKIYALALTKDEVRLLSFPYTKESANQAEKVRQKLEEGALVELNLRNGKFSDGGPFFDAEVLTEPMEPKE